MPTVPPPSLRSEVESGVTPPAGSEVESTGPRPPNRSSAPLTVSTLTERLQDVVLPYLKALEARLQIARHRTLLDDRLERDPPAIRFRLIPRRGPFDDVSAVPGSVLEVVADDGSSVAARLWLDPVAEEPTDELRVDADRLTERWIDEIAMDFVEQALRRR